MPPLWKQIQRIGVENFPYWLDDDDVCYYARDYVSEGGYGASEANQLISNFKKPPERRGRPEWHYKEQAIAQFAREIASIDNLEEFLVTCIPCSTSRQDPAYDPRLDDTLRVLKNLRPNVAVEFLLSFQENMTPAHHGGIRNPDIIYANLAWSRTRSTLTNIVVVDDVLTSGAHFKACKRMIIENITNAHVVGLFWARTVRPDR